MPIKNANKHQFEVNEIKYLLKVQQNYDSWFTFLTIFFCVLQVYQYLFLGQKYMQKPLWINN